MATSKQGTSGFNSVQNQRSNSSGKNAKQQRMTRQQSSFTQAVRNEQQGADDGFFGNADGPGPVSLSRKFSVRSGFGQNPEAAGRDEIL